MSKNLHTLGFMAYLDMFQELYGLAYTRSVFQEWADQADEGLRTLPETHIPVNYVRNRFGLMPIEEETP